MPGLSAELPTVDGAVIDPIASLGSSRIRSGAVLFFGGPSVPPVASAGSHLLRAVSGPTAGAEIAVGPDRTVRVGRSTEADLVLADPDVSRMHASVTVQGDTVVFTDLDSANKLQLEDLSIVEKAVLRSGEIVQLGASRIAVEAIGAGHASLTRDGQTGRFRVNRRPRLVEPPKPPTISLPQLPSTDEKHPFPWLMLVLPVVASSAFAIFTGHLYFLFGAALGPISAVASYYNERKQQARRAAVREADYQAAVSEASHLCDQAVDEADAYHRALWPDPASVVSIATTPRVELWQRRPDDPDWLSLRLGAADQNAGLTITGKRPPGWSVPILPRAPIHVSLELCGVVGIAGPASLAQESIRWALVQLAALHTPVDLRMVLIAPGAKEAEFGWLRWLPHLHDDADQVMAAWTEDEVDAVLKHIRDLVTERLDAAQPRRTPRLVVVLAGEALWQRGAVAELIQRGPGAGVTFLCLAGDERDLPSECQALFVRTAESAIVKARGGQQRVQPDQLSQVDAERVARALAPLAVVGAEAVGRIPDRVRYTDLAGQPTTDGLRAAWRLVPFNSEVVLGRGTDGEFAIDLVNDGPHAIIAGTTRSGKSELVQTLVGALARHNSPEALNFLFVDYKGGPTFKDFQDLPHVVSTVTNLDPALANRAISSLRAELKRRQVQLNSVGAENVGSYLRLRVADPDLPPFPRLVIIIDEFAELKQNLPDLLEELVSVSRTGASVGVHLVLATQRPSGVISPQIRSNASLAISLRMVDEQNSMDVINRPDAAHIPMDRPGRAYVQKGEKAPRLIQTAQITTPTGRSATVRRAVPLHWYDRAMPEPAAAVHGARTDLMELVRVVAEASALDGLRAPFPVLEPALPTLLTRAQLPPASAGTSRFHLVVGLQDLPEQQSRATLAIALGGGSLAVVGSAQSGRTSTLRAIAVDVASRYTPAEVHLHVLDGTGALGRLAELPNCGVSCPVGDPERVTRLIDRLHDEVIRRRRMLATHAAGSVNELWDTRPADAPPHIVVLVDGWESVAETSEDNRQRLVDMLGNGGSAGVTMIVAGDPGHLRTNVLSKIKHTLTLNSNNPADVASYLGLKLKPTGLPPGRGIWGADSTEVQVPLLATPADGPTQNGALTVLANELAGRQPVAAGLAPMRLDALPETILLKDPLLAPPLGASARIPLGVGGDRLGVHWLPLDRSQRVLVVGPQRSGRSTAAVAYAIALAEQGVPVQLIAARRRPIHDLAARSGVTVHDRPDATLVEAVVVVIDDLEAVAEDPTVLALLGSGSGSRTVIATARYESFAAMVPRALLALRGSTTARVMLGSADRLGMRSVNADNPTSITGPPGRAHLDLDGHTQVVQIPMVG
ncbi:S-DNA-T family DNA segregation ATPase FtsK/SpoIIIE [Allocatelliglobosispora scoriae]|uniref:S-DNA-T family DNA segregation ATPase FtsK/SpoIIIE n=1 Tax=Allocatelliglobosispora scoriae TaxID=643052 RepID=A0A841BNT1_9ACTN|nr:FtsK/SpoIIIE domain-containing protein [Allocatelliglobosispora scoriae]MBB5868613.1 S-DNA-T family DNA segregation ATPase FtsK/SpoIIIE [Allocatelliglobosispora scoriae]